MSTLNVGTANATTVNVGTGGLVFNDGTTQTTAPNPALALNDLTNVTAGSPSTGQQLQWNGSAWVNADASGGIDEGTVGQRANSPTGSSIRYNTDDDVLEAYMRNGGESMQAGWYAVGGRQLICRREIKTASSSHDFVWGSQSSQSNTKFWAYEVVFNFFESNGSGWYWRFRDANGSINSSEYYWANYLRAANDGSARMNGNSRGEVYLNCVTDSYRNTPNGEGHHLFHMYMMNCPNSDGANYWSYRWNGAGGNLTEGGNGMGLWGGGSWRGAASQGNSYPITGLRLYYTEGGKTVSQGAHTIVSVYGLAGHEGRNIGENYGLYG